MSISSSIPDRSRSKSWRSGHGATDLAVTTRKPGPARLKILRPFTRWLRQFEPGTEVPDDAIFGRIGARLTPHIYTEQEVVDLLAASRRLAACIGRATPAEPGGSSD